MAKANIDLSWLAGLLTGTPTAQTQSNTPDLDPGSEGKFLDPNFQDTAQPFQSPSAWQRMIHPEQAGQIDQMNNQFAVKPLAAAQDNQVKLNVAKSNIARMPHSVVPLGVTPDEAAATGYGTFQTPVELASQNRAMANMQGGITPLQSSTDINAAQENLQASNRALQRQPTVEAGLDQQSVNNLQKLLNVDQPSIRLAESQVKAELGREPTYEEVRERTLSNQLREQRDIIPAQHTLSLTQTGNAQDVASKTHELMPYTTGTMANDAVGKLASSRFQPLGEPFGNKIDGPMVTPGARNPLGMSPFQQQMQLMKDFTGQNTQELTLPSGKKVSVQIPAVDRASFNPLDVGNTTTATNMKVPVTHDTSGSMNPVIPPSSSSTTLPVAVQPSGFGGYRAVDSSADVNSKLKSVLQKYSSHPGFDEYIRKSALSDQLDPDSVTDFLSENLSKMTKEDRKQALSLLHQIQ